MSFTSKVAAGVMLAAATSTALTGCGKKTTPHTPSSSSTVKMSTSSSSAPKQGSSTSTSSSGAPTATATINGQVKHIRAGQLCQKNYADQYPAYGYTCAANSSGAYVLTKN